MQIVLYPEESLKKSCDRVNDFDEGLKRTIDEMAELMYVKNGVGIAAPQVGINKRIILVDHTSGQDGTALRIFVNPVIVYSSNEKELGIEGCLSLPGVMLKVSRSRQVEVEYQDVRGQTKRSIYSGYIARIIQHEVDHLDGIMITDHAAANEHRMTHEYLLKKAIGLPCLRVQNCLGSS